MRTVASADKISRHWERIGAYLRGEFIFPISLELDITSRCTLACTDCPSSRSEFQHSLPMPVVRELFAALEGQTKGLLMSGGEATTSPNFPAVLALAREHEFENIAVVSNGTLLHKARVAQALLEHASTIRISLYDWDGDGCGGTEPTLYKIEKLRASIEREASPLKIGVSVLTSKDRIAQLTALAEKARSAGAHWIYYHPLCVGWDTGNLRQVDQEGVLETVMRYRNEQAGDFGIFITPERYDTADIQFDGYHAAHFLLVVGADGKNYLGAEVKYQEQFALADLQETGTAAVLRNASRLQRIREINSRTYSALHSRHRGVLYNDRIERAKRGETCATHSTEYSFPYIL
jgi:MoaA/NifB/PqqE/SkfB family radical SAM enzyme